MLQMNEERYGKHNRGRMRRVRNKRTGRPDARCVNWCAVYWIAMLAAIVLLWYSIVTMLIDEGAALMAPAIVKSSLQLGSSRCANPTTSSSPAYVFHLPSPRPAYQLALDGGPRRQRLA